MNRWTDALLFVAIAVAAGCAIHSEEDAGALQGDDTLDVAGMKVVTGGSGEPAPDPNHRVECLNVILTDPRLGCIYQGLGVGGAQTLADQQTAAVGCGCTAEIVTTEVPGVEEGQQRVAIQCPGDPEFFGIFSPPPAPPGEPPFLGIHINPYPDDTDSKMCDVTLGNNGVVPRQEIEDCSNSNCHGKKLSPQWFPTVDSPAPPIPIEN